MPNEVPNEKNPISLPRGISRETIYCYLFIASVLFNVTTLVYYNSARLFPPIPTPVPPPTPPPKPTGLLRVILVSDSAVNMSDKQLEVINSTKLRSWLNDHCGKDSAGRAAWRSWPKDVKMANEIAEWKEAWETTKPMLGTLPRIIIFRGKTARAFDLPVSEDALITLLEKEGLD